MLSIVQVKKKGPLGNTKKKEKMFSKIFHQINKSGRQTLGRHILKIHKRKKKKHFSNKNLPNR
jgi:hypothetical protein